MNRELPDVQVGFRKGRGTRDQIANICWIIEKAREFQKSIYLCFIDYAKAFDSLDMSLSRLWELVVDREAWCATVHGVTKSRTLLSNWTELNWKPLTVWFMTNCGKFFKRWEYQIALPTSWEICMQVKKQQLELDMEQWTGSKLGKEYVKAVYCHPAYLTYVQNTSCKMLGWMKHKLESRLPGEIPITPDMQMTPSLWQKAKRN